MDNLTIFIAVTSAAVVIQAGILVAMFVTVRHTAAQVESLGNEFKANLLPVATMLVELRPKIENIVTNTSESSTMIKAQLDRLDATITETIDRAKLQIVRADELLTRTFDKVEHTGEIVQKTVSSPVRHISGVMQGLSTGIGVLLSQKRRRQNGSGVSDEMFI
jgi:hypothetical protein